MYNKIFYQPCFIILKFISLIIQTKTIYSTLQKLVYNNIYPLLGPIILPPSPLFVDSHNVLESSMDDDSVLSMDDRISHSSFTDANDRLQPFNSIQGRGLLNPPDITLGVSNGNNATHTARYTTKTTTVTNTISSSSCSSSSSSSKLCKPALVKVVRGHNSPPPQRRRNNKRVYNLDSSSDDLIIVAEHSAVKRSRPTIVIDSEEDDQINLVSIESSAFTPLRANSDNYLSVNSTTASHLQNVSTMTIASAASSECSTQGKPSKQYAQSKSLATMHSPRPRNSHASEVDCISLDDSKSAIAASEIDPVESCMNYIESAVRKGHSHADLFVPNDNVIQSSIAGNSDITDSTINHDNTTTAVATTTVANKNNTTTLNSFYVSRLPKILSPIFVCTPMHNHKRAPGSQGSSFVGPRSLERLVEPRKNPLLLAPPTHLSHPPLQSQSSLDDSLLSPGSSLDTVDIILPFNDTVDISSDFTANDKMHMSSSSSSSPCSPEVLIPYTAKLDYHNDHTAGSQKATSITPNSTQKPCNVNTSGKTPIDIDCVTPTPAHDNRNSRTTNDAVTINDADVSMSSVKSTGGDGNIENAEMVEKRVPSKIDDDDDVASRSQERPESVYAEAVAEMNDDECVPAVNESSDFHSATEMLSTPTPMCGEIQPDGQGKQHPNTDSANDCPSPCFETPVNDTDHIDYNLDKDEDTAWDADTRVTTVVTAYRQGDLDTNQQSEAISSNADILGNVGIEIFKTFYYDIIIVCFAKHIIEYNRFKTINKSQLQFSMDSFINNPYVS